VDAGDPFCGAAGRKTLLKWPAIEAHRQGRGGEMMALDLVDGWVPRAQLHELRRTKGVPWDLLNGELKL
jgi:hypothetical protein